MSTRPEMRDETHDPRLARWYREAGQPEPSPALDQAILAAAHREVGARPRAASSFLRRWRVPFSLAAVVVLSVTTITLVRERGGEPLDVAAPSYPAQRAAQPPTIPRTPPGPAGDTAQVDRLQGARGAPESHGRPPSEAPSVRAPAGSSAAMQTQSAPQQAPPQPTLPQVELGERAAAGEAPMEAISGRAKAAGGVVLGDHEGSRGRTGPEREPEPVRQEVARAAAQAREGVAPLAIVPKRVAPAASAPVNPQDRDSAAGEMRSMARPRPAAKPGPDSVALEPLLKALASQGPERWLEKIEELRRAERAADADKLLAAFRKRFPDHPVSPGK